MNNKKIISVILTLAVVFTSIPTVSYTIQAKRKVISLTKKTITVTKGKTKTAKLKNATKKVRWKVVSGRKNVKIVKKYGKNQNKIKIKAKGKGDAVIVAVHGKKICALKVKVKDKSAVRPEPTVKPKEEPTTKVEPTTEETKSEYATVTFIGNDKKSVVCTKEYQKGKPYGSFPKLYEEGYLFLGWHMDSSIGKKVWESDICEGNITLYASFVMLLPEVEETYELVEE